jgi:hypothetical protein
MARHPAIAVAGIALAASLAAGPARGASTTILITEVEADPVNLGFDSPWEWFEVRNVSAQARTLTNWTMADNQVSSGLPTIALEPGECVILATNSANFGAAHPGYTGRVVQVGSIGAGLENAADFIVLRDGSGVDVDCVSWGTATNCFNPGAPVPAFNTVATLQRASLIDTDAAADWTSNGSETPCPGAVGVSALEGAPSLTVAPNPARGRTTISCAGVGAGPLVVAIHDAAGRRIRTLRDGSAGAVRNLAWNGLDDEGRAVPAGVYFVTLPARSGAPAGRRLLLLR